MERIESKSLKEQVQESLRNAIVNGELKPGQPLVGADLANQLGVSNATIREAIQTLSVEGLVETVTYRVPTVKQLSRKDIEDIFSVRGMLEAFAVRRILLSDDLPTVVEELYACCDGMDEAAEQGSLQDLNRIDRQFHEILIRYGDNELLAMFWNSVAQRVRQVMSLRNQQKGSLYLIAQNHRTITEAIARQDEALSVQLISEHVGLLGETIADTWNEEAFDKNYP